MTGPERKLPTVIARMWGREPGSRRGPRPGLTLDRITDAAIGIADAEGLTGVRMSSVAARLGVSTMSLYGYVESKDELLAAMVDAAAPDPPEPGTLSWREYVTEWTRANRDFLASHPWLLEVSPLTPPTGPRTLRWLDRSLTALTGAGLTAAEAINITTTLTAYATSSATLLAAMSGTVDEAGPAESQARDRSRVVFAAAGLVGRRPRKGQRHRQGGRRRRRIQGGRFSRSRARADRPVARVRPARAGQRHLLHARSADRPEGRAASAASRVQLEHRHRAREHPQACGDGARERLARTRRPAHGRRTRTTRTREGPLAPGPGLAAFLYAERLQRSRDVRGLIRALARRRLRRVAADALGRLQAVEAVPALIELMARSSPNDRTRLAAALGSIGDKRAAPALQSALADSDLDVEWAAHTALGELGDEFAPADPFARHERQLGETVREAARPALEAGAATLTWKPADGPAPALFEVIPANPRACEAHVQADLVQQVSLFIGPHGTWWETWDADRSLLLAWVADTVRGIADGRYEEWVHPGEFRQAKGVLHVPGGEDIVIYNNILFRQQYWDFEHLTYEPYLKVPGVGVEPTSP